MDATRRKRVTLRPADERRAIAAEAGVVSACDSADDALAAVERFIEDVDSDRFGAGGVVAEPLSDEDSLVQHLDEGLVAVSRAQAGRRP